MLTISSELIDAMVHQARCDYPIETCGLVTRHAHTHVHSRLVRLTNAAVSSDEFHVASSEQLAVWREMESRDEEVAVLFHSHTESPAFPSRADIDRAGEPGAHYLIVGIGLSDTAEVRSFRIVNGIVVEETLRIVQASK
ncbi:M67 family metallopeptidase [Pandoraea pnomenusa]|uniref:M67 family metallopeptidase n=1 Tax=Pandoraea pnomenusa TaxID=93220 RepID=UPI00333F289B